MQDLLARAHRQRRVGRDDRGQLKCRLLGGAGRDQPGPARQAEGGILGRDHQVAGDTYVKDEGAGSRSAALHKAVGLLRDAQLATAYEDAWASWDSTDDSKVWVAALADGLDS